MAQGVVGYTQYFTGLPWAVVLVHMLLATPARRGPHPGHGPAPRPGLRSADRGPVVPQALLCNCSCATTLVGHARDSTPRRPHRHRGQGPQRHGQPVPLADDGRPQGRRALHRLRPRRPHRPGRRQRQPPPQGPRRGRPRRGGARARQGPPRAVVAPGRPRHPLVPGRLRRRHRGRHGRVCRRGPGPAAPVRAHPGLERQRRVGPRVGRRLLRHPELDAPVPRRSSSRSPTRWSTC